MAAADPAATTDMSNITKAIGAVAGFGAACFCWGLLEAKLYTVRQVTLPVLPAGFGRSIRVLHVSDLHMMARQQSKLDFVRSLADLEPDLVVNTGDNISEAGAIGPLLDAFGALADVPGVFVFGSNDYHAPRFKNPLGYLLRGRSFTSDKPKGLPTQELRDGFAKLGWEDLTHRRVSLDVAGQRFAFRGTDDAHLDRDDYASVAGSPDPDALLNIGVTHAPYLRLLDSFTGDGMDLVMAGHTHGGQVCVPFYGALVTNCDLDTARVKGLSSHEAGGRTSHLHVSAGLGAAPTAPYRFACRPEVTLLRLTPAPSSR